MTAHQSRPELTIGRSVWFTLDSGAIRPAVVTDVTDATTVNLAVFTDVADVLPCPLLVREKHEGVGIGKWCFPVVPPKPARTAAAAAETKE